MENCAQELYLVGYSVDSSAPDLDDKTLYFWVDDI